MILIGVILLTLLVLIVPGYFLVRRRKREEIEKRKKKARQACRNKTMSTAEIIKAIDAPQKNKTEAEPAANLITSQQSKLALSEKQAEEWLISIKTSLPELVEARKEAGRLEALWDDTTKDQTRKRKALDDDCVPSLSDDADSFSAAARRFLDRQSNLFRLQESIVELPGQLESSVDKLIACHKQVLRVLKPIERLRENQLPRNVLAARIVATELLESIDGRLKKALTLPSDAKKVLKGIIFYRQTFGPASPEQDEAETQLRSCLTTLFSACHQVEQTKEAFESTEWKRKRADARIEELQSEDLESSAPEAVDAWLAPLKASLIDLFALDDEIAVTHAPALQESASAMANALYELDLLLARCEKVKSPTAHFFALRKVARTWYSALINHHASLSLPKPTFQDRPKQASPEVAALVAKLTKRLKRANGIRGKLENLENRVKETASLAAGLEIAEVPDKPKATSVEQYLEEVSQVVLLSLVANDAAQQEAAIFCRQVALFEESENSAFEVLLQLIALSPANSLELDSRALCVDDAASIKACDCLLKMIVNERREWQSRIEDYNHDEEEIVRPAQRSEKVVSIVESFKQGLELVYVLQGSLNNLLAQANESYEKARSVSNNSKVIQPEKPSDSEVSKYLDDLRQWALRVREAKETAWHDKQAFAEELNSLVAQVSALKTLNHELCGLCSDADFTGLAGLHIDDEAIIFVIKNFTQDHLNSGRDDYERQLHVLNIRAPFKQPDNDVTLPSSSTEAVAYYHDEQSGQNASQDYTRDREAITLDYLRKSQRSLVFARAQFSLAYAKLQVEQSRTIDTEEDAEQPVLPDVSVETFDFNRLVDKAVSYNEMLVRNSRLGNDLTLVREKAKLACDARRTTVFDRASALRELVAKIDKATVYGDTSAWIDELTVAMELYEEESDGGAPEASHSHYHGCLGFMF